MKRELDYFTIEGAFGGNQEWFTNVVMNIGGCGAATACDSCIYFARRPDMRQLYPFDRDGLTVKDYKRFSQIMKPYIRPRAGGVKKPQWYVDGLSRYISDVNAREGCDIKLQMDILPGDRPYTEAAEKIRQQIDAGYPVPYLMLRHKNQKFKDFIWHWFLVVGYEEKEDGLEIVTATYGEAARISLRELWDTGHEEKGGLILYK
ncbi:hypothetical protein [[Clostridium] hylemonae]|uniref:Peptidase C39-like domain-containing protein n=1 Tax=[Clostridium] hylemonae DSM 15053 TaxID=553973 RepID=C0C4L7_9FIRM|nr:hypothetical protein [[Clostridium] hylemonae]EEG73010.1 hypothetical protein CLOHYLEM_07033 [[Clostridium] hylemonae DSM 15053]QEK16245.1 hypothetical protein LAJLEIBI_00225 [[Clostridium] hylemonae DSM 15053]